MQNNIILTGIPRSGTSFLTVLINKHFKNSVALNETLVAPENMLQQFNVTRQRIKSGLPIPNKYNLRGELASNSYSEGRQTEVLMRKVSKPMNEDCAIIAQANIPYLTSLPLLISQGFKVLALIRDPLYSLSSWNSKNVPGLNHDKISDNPKFKDVQWTSEDGYERQVELWNVLAGDILSAEIATYKYEWLCDDPALVLNRMASLCHVDMQGEVDAIESRNLAKAYPEHTENVFRALAKNQEVANSWRYYYESR